MLISYLHKGGTKNIHSGYIYWNKSRCEIIFSSKKSGIRVIECEKNLISFTIIKFYTQILSIEKHYMKYMMNY